MADQFGASTAQDLKSGGDGAKLYGWNVLNSANATVIDVDSSNAGYLTFVTGAYSDPDVAGYPFTMPFVYQNITGDFEIDIKRDALASGSNYRFWLIARDPTASASEDYVAIWTYYDSGGANYLAKRRSIANSAQSPADSLLDPTDPPLYTKIQRVGNTFKFYTSINGTSWTYWSTRDVTRNDFGATIQVGIGAGINNTYKFDYFQGTNSGNDASNTVVLTWPSLTLSASGSGASVGSGVLTLPKFATTGEGTQAGNFCSLFSPVIELAATGDAGAYTFGAATMPSLSLTSETAPLISSDITMASFSCIGDIPPVNAAWTEDNPLIINGNVLKGLVVPLLSSSATGLTGNVSDALLQQPMQIPAPVIEMTIGGHCRINAPAMTAEATGLTGNAASLDWRLPLLETSNTATHSSSCEAEIALPLASASGVALTGGMATATLQATTTLASGCGVVGNVATGNVAIPVVVDDTFAYVNVYGNGVLELLPLDVVAADGWAGHGRMPVISLQMAGSIGTTANAALTLPVLQETDMVMYAVAIYEGSLSLLRPIVDAHGSMVYV